MEDGDNIGEEVLNHIPIGDIEQEVLSIDKPEQEQPKPILEISPISTFFYETPRSEQSTVDIPNPEITTVQNEKPLYTLTPEAGSSRNKLTLRKIYAFMIGVMAFLINKVLMPFGENVLMNTTLWVVLRCMVEVILEMLLYIILAICYVFLKFIAQMEQKKTLKSIPKIEEEDGGSTTRTGDGTNSMSFAN
ncbi:hypothetical protein HHI36_000957 [Cryptolaemus montrouzieri]|uniref:Uncharacterized protein n=1 Tax=Cryptolaemus montrouzieri TaxID=559131 RepID=A0ABD2P735_9CUCU